MGETVLFIICIALIVIGFIGIIVPVLPGTVLIFLSTFIYAVFTHFRDITGGTLAVFALLTALSFAVDYIANIIGVKKFGASRYGLYGMLVGGLLGLLVGSIPGLIIGQLIGVIVGEMYFGKAINQSLQAGIGVFLGMILGSIAKIMIASIITVIFIMKIIT